MSALINTVVLSLISLIFTDDLEILTDDLEILTDDLRPVVKDVDIQPINPCTLQVSFGHVEGKNEVNPSLINLVFHLDQTFTDKKLDTLVTQEILDKV